MSDFKETSVLGEAHLDRASKEQGAFEGDPMLWDAAAEKRLIRKIDWRVR